jgi:hypothetical protein
MLGCLPALCVSGPACHPSRSSHLPHYALTSLTLTLPPLQPHDQGTDIVVQASKVFTRSEGDLSTLEYRVRFYVKDSIGRDVQISPWHDIPLANDDGVCHAMPCQIEEKIGQAFD